MNERELLMDCLARLNQAGIAYMLTGSMASNYWGIPRSTHDLDFAIQLPPTAVPVIVAAFAREFQLEEHSVYAAFRPPFQFNAIDTRSALKVDFWLPANIPFEREMFRRRVCRTIFGIPAWIATPEDLVLHKLYWHKLTPSPRELSDAVGVVVVQKDQLNLAYLQHWATELGVGETLASIIEGKLKPKIT